MTAIGKKIDFQELIPAAMECLGVAVSIIDTEGILLYYNKKAAKILDRQPEYIGNSVISHHKKTASTKKLKAMIQSFLEGRIEPYHYTAKPYGKIISVTFSPILKDDKLLGCVQVVRLKKARE